jgi:hypothetical protein
MFHVEAHLLTLPKCALSILGDKLERKEENYIWRKISLEYSTRKYVEFIDGNVCN